MAALTAALIIGAGLSAAGTAQNAIAAHRAAKGAKQMGEYEGEMYDKQAADAIARGDETANQTASQSRILTGAQRASLAASGIDSTSGSASDIQTNDQKIALLSERQQHLNAAREAFGFTEQGRLARMGGSNAAQGYNNQMTSTLLGGAADLFTRYQAFRVNRVPRPTSIPTTTDVGGTTGGFYGGKASP